MKDILATFTEKLLDAIAEVLSGESDASRASDDTRSG